MYNIFTGLIQAGEKVMPKIELRKVSIFLNGNPLYLMKMILYANPSDIVLIMAQEKLLITLFDFNAPIENLSNSDFCLVDLFFSIYFNVSTTTGFVYTFSLSRASEFVHTEIGWHIWAICCSSVLRVAIVHTQSNGQYYNIYQFIPNPIVVSKYVLYSRTVWFFIFLYVKESTFTSWFMGS